MVIVLLKSRVSRGKKNKMKKIYILTTGGTIEKSYDESDGSLFNRSTIIRETIFRRLRLPYTEVEVISLMAKDSLDMVDQDREHIYNEIIKRSHDHIPIVVLHGTDTLEKTLRFCYQQNQGKIQTTVVFTGAMRPLGFDRSDADQNITEALCAAHLLPPGFYLSFHGEIFKAPHVSKNRQTRTFERSEE